MSPKKAREIQLFNWLEQQIEPMPSASLEIKLISGDASFRRYYRVKHQNQSYIAVDAPPETEDNALFVHLSEQLNQADIPVSKVLAADLKLGFMLQQDNGDVHLADIINPDNAKQAYTQLWPVIAKFQHCHQNSQIELPAYAPEFVKTELEIFSTWFIQQGLNYSLSSAEQELLARSYQILTDNFSQQPQVAVHRDFHCRNIMLNQGLLEQPILIDFQGALIGPASYDLVSLLKDCYLVWSNALVDQLSDNFRQAYYPHVDENTWQTWFDLTGLQRHIKCAGIFVRLAMRDNKPAYLNYLSNVIQYIKSTIVKYPELAEFAYWFEHKIYPVYQTKVQSNLLGTNISSVKG
ncbi:aminoglycoside phosphotransferase family protein [Catenovulum adriaticum]|uniref:Phosphotransferase n=1 Tax=Catenovulum adriaticum TaxID=2984846 RepID=A0ABY7ANT5_9ALTE|nr:phosphotransferase [Catenovulum sp. TS8]WAJ70377.1 phosphotransferase [Catenovulum sp. TS8]